MYSNIEELEVALSSAKTEQERLYYLTELSRYCQSTDFQKSINFAKQALDIAESLPDPTGIVYAANLLGKGYNNLGEFVQSLEYALLALAAAQEQGILREEAEAWGSIAVSHTTAGDYAEALEAFLKELAIGEELQDATILAVTHHNIAGHHYTLGEYEQMLVHLEKALEYVDSVDDPIRRTAYIWVGLGLAYAKLGDYPSALNYNQQALSLAEKHDLPHISVSALATIAEVYQRMEDYPSAERYYHQALQQAKENGIKSYIQISLIGIGQIHRHQDQNEAAIESFETALVLAEGQQSIPKIVTLHEELAETHKKMGNYKIALEYAQTGHRIQLQAFEDRAKSRLQVLQVQHKVEAAQKEVKLQKLRSEALQRELDERARAEEAHLEQMRLRIALEKEQELATIKEQIMIRLSHEFRTPLAIIRTSTEILKHGIGRLSDEKHAEKYATIISQVERIDNILSNILTVLKSPYGQLHYEPVELELEQVCQRAITLVAAESQAKERIIFENKTIEQCVVWDKTLVNEIITNLLSNALKFSTASVYFRVSCVADMILIEVEDSGIGIPIDEQKDIFKPLYRASNLDEVAGNGLGLTIVQDCVSVQEGTLEIISELGVGTTVRVFLPVMHSA